MNSYLFPYEKIPYKAKIIIYGAGEMGIEYYKQMLTTGYCKVLAFVDRNSGEYLSVDGIPIISVDEINSFEFDYILVAIKNKSWWMQVKDSLSEIEIGSDRIVFGEMRNTDLSISFYSAVTEKETICNVDNATNIALYITGGYGDSIINKRFVEELIRMCPWCNLYIFVSSSADFAKTLYYSCDNVRKIKTNIAMEYQTHRDEYDLAISIFGSGFVKVDYIDEEKLNSANSYFADKIKELKRATDNQEFDTDQCIYPVFYQRIFKGQDAYSAFSYDGILNIRDKKVQITLDDNFLSEYELMKLTQYITVNCGNGTRKGAHSIAKSWPIERFEKVLEHIKSNKPEYEVLQIGAEDAPRLHNVDRYCLGEDFRLVEYILKNAIFHLDIEGGMVHLATQLGTKCIVLFGQSNIAYYGYSENINIKAGSCHGCAGLYKDINRCARDMEEPECMYSITPELVMERVNTYLKSLE